MQRRRTSSVAFCLAALFTLACGGRTLVDDAPEISTWKEDRRIKLILRQAERRIMKKPNDPPPEVLAQLVQALDALGRQAEAQALRDYFNRYTAGADSNGDKPPVWPECERNSIRSRVIRSWGSKVRVLPIGGRFELGRVTGAFQIASDGEILKIQVMKAKHPAAAWVMVDMIGDAQISHGRLDRLVHDSPEMFPADFCVNWNFGSPKIRTKDGGDYKPIP